MVKQECETPPSPASSQVHCGKRGRKVHRALQLAEPPADIWFSERSSKRPRRKIHAGSMGSSWFHSFKYGGSAHRAGGQQLLHETVASARLCLNSGPHWDQLSNPPLTISTSTGKTVMLGAEQGNESVAKPHNHSVTVHTIRARDALLGIGCKPGMTS